MCSNCGRILDGNGQHIISHAGSHTLNDPNVNRSSEPCGLCLSPAPICRIFLRKGKGAGSGLQINCAASSCPNLVNFSYAKASKSTQTSPCSNVPLLCPLCPKDAPAVWRYNMKYHLMNTHPHAPLPKYQQLWMLSNFEISEMLKIWNDRRKTTKKRKQKNPPALLISEAHSSRLASQYVPFSLSLLVYVH